MRFNIRTGFELNRLAAVLFLAVAALSLKTKRAKADCPDEWFPVFGVPAGTDGQCRAVTTWDPDGAGPLLPQPVVGGDFTNAGGLFANHIARFDGVMWQTFGSGPATGLGGAVRALISWDPDGSGPLPAQLIAGGDFVASGSTTLNRIARWDGSAWQPMGGGFTGSTAPGVYSLVLWDPDGPGPLPERLVAGGNFATTTGGTTVNRVAWWDGAAWQPLGNGFVNGTTLALAVYDPDGPGPLTPRLVAGGDWITSGSTTVNRAAWWDGTAWQPLGPGFDGRVVGLTAWDSDGPGPASEQIVATGDFLHSGATGVQFIARWDGSAWLPLGLGLGSSSDCVGTWDPDGPGPLLPEVIAGGSFNWAGGNTINRLARWNGSVWQGFATEIPSGTVYALAQWDPDGSGPLLPGPLAVGSIVTAGTRTVANVASWQGSDWRQLGNGLGTGATTGAVFALNTWDSDGAGPGNAQVIAGGTFTVASGKVVNHIARFDGSEWQPLGTGMTGGLGGGTVNGLTTWDPDGGGPLGDELVAVGDFTTAGGITVNQVAHWNGTQWQAFGTGIGGHLATVTIWDTDGPGGAPGIVVVGGTFTEAAGKPGNYVAMWNGSTWQRMDNGFIDTVFALASFSPTGNPADSRIYAGGQFGSGGAPPFQYIAQWNGAAWSSLVNGVNSNVQALTEWHGSSPRLVAGGAFSTASTTIANRVAAWTGSAWVSTAFEPGLSGLPGVVYALTSWDPDGPGPLGQQVIAGGSITKTTSINPPALNNIAHWDGNSWEPLGLGTNTNGTVFALTTWDPDGPGPQSAMLVAGGAFNTAGGLPGSLISALDGCHTTCNSCDINCDGSVNAADIQPFVNLLLGTTSACSSCAGDTNGDGQLNGDDITGYVACLIP